jgi:hypothetical protein
MSSSAGSTSGWLEERRASRRDISRGNWRVGRTLLSDAFDCGFARVVRTLLSDAFAFARVGRTFLSDALGGAALSALHLRTIPKTVIPSAAR